MKHLAIVTSALLATLGVAAFHTGPASAQESFRVDLGKDGETIGDMRPVFLKFESQAMPAISPKEVARRYQRLFDQSDEPEVRIDALNRLANLQSLSGEDLRFSDEQEQKVYRDALESYDAILERGAFQGRLDELLYQMAKAHAFVGQGEESTQRLQQLVGLYPSSPLVPEARFRIAESAFAAGRYAEAETVYLRVLSSEASDSLKQKARYMLGWSQYKQGSSAHERAGQTFLTALDESAHQTDGFQRITAGDREVVEDTFRIVAIMAANAGGARFLERLMAQGGERSYADLLYDRLADYYAANGRFAQSVAVNDTFVSRYPGHASGPGFQAQVVDVWLMAGAPDKARKARADYVAAYQDSAAYARLARPEQQRWQDFSRRLADYHYQQGSAATGERRVSLFAMAANYYSGLAPTESQPGDVRRLAGDAWLQAREYRRALHAYELAAYESGAYDGAADAAWAALVLRTQALDGDIAMVGDLTELARSATRFAASYPDDHRVPGLEASVANRLLKDGHYRQALQFASVAVERAAATQADAYSAWLVLGQSHAALAEHGSAERSWRQALSLAEQSDDVSRADTDKVRAQLAASIYRQGEQALEDGDTDRAVAHFQRVESVAPGSETAIRGRFDAANSLLAAERWQPAINELQRFRADYPRHSLTPAIREKLVLAYQSSGQPVRAADELMTTAESSPGQWRDRLRAAQLYHQGGAFERRNRLYSGYLAQAPAVDSADEHVLQQRMRQRLLASGIREQAYREQLVSRELASQWHSEDTLGWAAQAALTLGEQATAVFNGIALAHPLANSLERKQDALSAALERFLQAEQLGGDDVRSESLYRRAELYRGLARDLIASGRPEGLNELELSQYDMLVEEEAYPFEEKAIALHEQNHRQLSQGHYDRWIEKSLEALGTLFPGRYARELRWMTWSQEAKDGV